MKIDPKKTACLTLDLQRGILQMIPGSETILANAARVVDLARGQGMRVIHVGIGFTQGYPELPAQSPFGDRVKQHNLFIKGTPSTEFHSGLVQPGDLVVYKQRVGAFSENELHLILRSQGIQTLIYFGIATSGIVLSTVRRAFDLDYRSIIIGDACLDRDPEVHRVLIEKVFPGQATVVDTQQFIAGN